MKVIFLKNDEALKECSGMPADDERLIELNCKFLEEKYKEGYKPICYDFNAGGFYFEDPRPSFKIEKIIIHPLIGKIYEIKDPERKTDRSSLMYLDDKLFMASSVQGSTFNEKIIVVGKYIETDQ